MPAPFIVGPSLRELLHIFTSLLRMTDKVRVAEGEEISFFELNDRDVLIYTRVLKGKRFAFESRVRRSDVLEVKLGEPPSDNDLACIELIARANSIEQVMFMHQPGSRVDTGYSHDRDSSLKLLVPAKAQELACGLLRRIVGDPPSEWFAELPSLWEDCRR